jgi:hypothetical protein
VRLAGWLAGCAPVAFSHLTPPGPSSPSRFPPAPAPRFSSGGGTRGQDSAAVAAFTSEAVSRPHRLVLVLFIGAEPAWGALDSIRSAATLVPAARVRDRPVSAGSSLPFPSLPFYCCRGGSRRGTFPLAAAGGGSREGCQRFGSPRVAFGRPFYSRQAGATSELTSTTRCHVVVGVVPAACVLACWLAGLFLKTDAVPVRASDPLPESPRVCNRKQNLVRLRLFMNRHESEPRL